VVDPQQVLYLESSQPVDARMRRAALKGDLRGLLHHTIGHPRRHVGQLHDLPLLVLEDAHDPSDAP
jgi:hypothetical protein